MAPRNHEALTPDEIEEAVEKGVIRAFKTLGLDVENPHEAQRDFAFLRDFRKGTHSLSQKTIWVVLSGIVLAICGFVWAGFKIAVHGKG